MNFTFDDITYWVGDGDNRAMLIIQWNDGKKPDALAWGYRWNGTKSGANMLIEIAREDERLFFLAYGSSGYGTAIGGIGFNASGRKDVKLNNSGICINPPAAYGTCGDEYLQNPRSCETPNITTGVILTSDYDFDHWTICNGNNTARWASGWYAKYMTYFVTDWRPAHIVGEQWIYSGLGASSRVLKNNSIDAWYMDNDAFMGNGKGAFSCMSSTDDYRCDGREFFGIITPVTQPSN
jgi:hypothetical protein